MWMPGGCTSWQRRLPTSSTPGHASSQVCRQAGRHRYRIVCVCVRACMNCNMWLTLDAVAFQHLEQSLLCALHPRVSLCFVCVVHMTYRQPGQPADHTNLRWHRRPGSCRRLPQALLQVCLSVCCFACPALPVCVRPVCVPACLQAPPLGSAHT